MRMWIGAAALAVLTSAAWAVETMDHSAHMATGEMSEASKAYAEINAKMHEEMNIDFTGDADVDFIRGMIAHHRGAVDMARVVIEYGQDPAVRALAEGVVAAQEAEIAWMDGWLAGKGM